MASFVARVVESQRDFFLFDFRIGSRYKRQLKERDSVKRDV